MDAYYPLSLHAAASAGSFQERIIKQPYGEGDNKEFFKHSLFIVLCNRVLTCSVAVVILLVSLSTSRAPRTALASAASNLGVTVLEVQTFWPKGARQTPGCSLPGCAVYVSRFKGSLWHQLRLYIHMQQSHYQTSLPLAVSMR